MLYYSIRFEDGDDGIFATEQVLRKNQVVVVPVGDTDYTCGRVNAKVSTLTGLAHEQNCGEVLPVLSVIDVKDFEKSRIAKAQMANMERVLNQKMTELKTLDTLEKFAGKDANFASLLSEYKQMMNGNVPSSESEDIPKFDDDEEQM
jgi:hypothetical protein